MAITAAAMRFIVAAALETEVLTEHQVIVRSTAQLVVVLTATAGRYKEAVKRQPYDQIIQITGSLMVR